MITITLGREGDQPFTIKQEGVSKKHARLIVDGDEWTLEDLSSSNGTFIIDEEGKATRVGRLRIMPHTLILLGPNNSNGCSFYASHAIYSDSYDKEFDILEEHDSKLREKEEHAERMATIIRKVIAVVSVVALVGSFAVPDNNLQMILLRAGTAITAFSSLFYDPSKQKKRLKEIREGYFKCPNPTCPHTLTQKEIHNRRCSKCKTQG